MVHKVHKTEGVNRTKKVRFYSFVFTGKERDEETGYGYFGARYMDHELTTMWLSVDPMADKYPSISPYAYCACNPVKLVDPDGNEAIDNDDGWKVDRKNRTITRISSDGGDAFQYINDNGVWRSFMGTQSDVLEQYDGFALVDDVQNGFQLSQKEGKDNSSSGLPGTVVGVTIGYIGYSCNRMAKAIFDYDNGTYMGKDGSTKAIQKGKNGGLNGRYKNQQKLSANYSKVATGLKWLGRGSAVYSALNTEIQAQRSEISNQERWTNHVVNVISSLPYCWHASFFYELGKNHGPSKWFQ